MAEATLVAKVYRLSLGPYVSFVTPLTLKTIINHHFNKTGRNEEHEFTSMKGSQNSGRDRLWKDSRIRYNKLDILSYDSWFINCKYIVEPTFLYTQSVLLPNYRLVEPSWYIFKLSKHVPYLILVGCKRRRLMFPCVAV